MDIGPPRSPARRGIPPRVGTGPAASLPRRCRAVEAGRVRERAPDRGEQDYTALTTRFRNEEEIVPDVSRLTSATLVSFVTSPLVGELHSPTTAPYLVAWYLLIGGGGVSTREDTALIRSPCDAWATVQQRQEDVANGCHYVDQVHPAFTFGTGRIARTRCFLRHSPGPRPRLRWRRARSRWPRSAPRGR